MNPTLEKSIPLMFIILGLLLLFIIGQVIPAGVCFLIGFAMILETIWPEKWKSDN
jgi:hypothetical protein